jgi:hypothetical protein
MRGKYISLFFLLMLISFSAQAQSNNPITPKGGYWLSTTTANHQCHDANDVYNGNLATTGYQEIIPLTISEDGNGVYLYNVALRRYQNGYHGDVFPDRPETIRDSYSSYGSLTLQSAESMTLIMGIVNKEIPDQEGKPCFYYTTYQLDYIGEERPAVETGAFKAGYWTIEREQHPDNQSYCLADYIAPIMISADGKPQNYHFIFPRTANGDYYLDLTEQEDFPDWITITPTSDETFTGSYHFYGCQAEISGQFEREFITISNYDDLGNDPSVTLESGFWNVYSGTQQTVLEGTCDARTSYLSHVAQVSPDGQVIDFISSYGIWTLVRDERGLYTGAYGNQPSYLVIEPISPTAFNYHWEQTQEGCVVLQTGRGSWDGDLLSPTIEPILVDDLPPSDTPLVDCTISASGTVNLRAGAGTTFDRAGTLQAGQNEPALGQSEASDGYTWYNLANGAWVREDVITATGDCDQLPSLN